IFSSYVTATGLSVEESEGPGAYVLGGTLSCEGCTLTDNDFAGVGVTAGYLILTDSTITGTEADVNHGGGLGIAAGWFLDDVEGTSYVYTRGVTVSDNHMGAVLLEGQGAYWLESSSFHGGEGVEVCAGQWGHGDAVLASGGVSAWETDGEQILGLSLVDVTLADSAGAGLFLDGSAATLSEVTWQDNEVDWVRQACGELDSEGLDEAEVESSLDCASYDYRLTSLRYYLEYDEPDVEIGARR
ncbi:MAG: hypothetical protein QGG40_16540, partial [Myxococcota bacterium]|nr:hypothetical protein [Myxococcota bacterium]